MSAPTKLTFIRYMTLKTIAERPHLMRREFFASELERTTKSGHRYGGTGPTLDSLRKVGWVERVVIGGLPASNAPFHLPAASASCWRLTDAGREAIANLPTDVPDDVSYDSWDRWLAKWLMSREAAE